SGTVASDAAFHQVTLFFILPFLLLAPVNGAISNGLPKRWVLVGSSAFSLLMVLLWTALEQPTTAVAWVWCIGLTLNMTGAAVYGPTRYALLPAAADDTRIPLPRVTGWIETGGAFGLMVGPLLALASQDFALVLWLVVGLNVVGVLAAIPVW